MVSEKHRETAQSVVDDINLNDASAVPAIAAALANAEREGMKRAAEIANKLAADQRQTNVRNPRHAECYPDWVKRITHYERVAAAILSEITNQPGSSSLPADSAPEAGSSSTVSGVTHYTRPAPLAVPGDEPSIPSSADGGVKMESGGSRNPGRADDASGCVHAQAEQVATHSNPRLTSAGTPPVDAANCERIAQAADASPSYSEQEG